MLTSEKVRENRARRAAARRGWSLSKSRMRDPLGVGFGTWTANGVPGLSIDEVIALIGGIDD
jgi:hypothetical protein